ncbi:restriction endonuclease subunit S [Empedobacter stercoris]|uniref:restriction endonuclease subunit S n=1 Tax=Empedobacter stercoris TaxID=1628248 RepID=UPI0021B08E87|nr:restriction endonuclease subunit S [Empedobacter stercoris]UWX68146.1 restriction endonuclease subunit S [Empedobacter stercoris]
MEKVLLTDICRPKQWKTISTSQLKENGYPVFGANGIIGFYDEYTHEEPTLLITCRGATCGTLNISLPKSYVNGNAMALDNLSKDYDLKFLYYYLSQRGFNDVISGSAQPQITRENLSKVKVLKPALEIQKQIVEKLDKAQEIIRYNEEIIAKYDALTQSLFLDMFGDPVKNEKGWEMVNFENVMSLKRGYDLPVQDRIKDGKIPVFGSNGILDYHDTYKTDKPCLITGRSGTIGLIHKSIEPCWPLNTSLYSYKTNDNNIIFLEYLLRYFKIERFSHGAGVPTLDRKLVHKENIPNIPLELQNQFAERVSAIETQKQLAVQALQQSENLFNSLLQQAFKK